MKQAVRLRLTAGMISAGLVALLGWLFVSPQFHFGNAVVQASYDTLHRMSTPSLTNGDVVIVYLDLESYLSTKQDPSQPWSRALHSKLVRRLTASGARAIVFDVVFSGRSAHPQDDEAFAQAIRESGRVILAAELNASGQSTGNAGAKTLTLRPPDEPFASAAAAWGLASLHVDDDFVVRRHFSGFDAQPSLTAATASLLRVPRATAASQWVRYYGPPLTVPHVSYTSALSTNDVPDVMFRGKVVFIGARPFVAGFRERRDELRTPFRVWTDNQLFMPAVEIHATEMLNLTRGDWLTRSARAEVVVVVLVMFAFGTALMFVRPLPASFLALLAAGGVCVASQSAFTRGVWFPWLIVAAVQIPASLFGSIVVNSVEWYRTRRRMEAAKRAADAKIREQASLIDKATDAILVQDIAGRVLYANPSAEKLYGWPLAELQGAERPITFCSDLNEWNAARAALLQDGDWSGELHQQTRQGSKLIVAARWTLIRDDAGRASALLMIHSDVTERRQLETQLLRTQRLDTIGSIASGMAHDLNNALSPVLLGTQLLKRKADEETGRTLSLMEESALRGADMVRQVLLFARGKGGDVESVNVGALVKDIAGMARNTFPKNITVDTYVADDLAPVRGNITQLHQVLLNLCVNARDAMPGGGRLSLIADQVSVSEDEATNTSGAHAGEFISLSVSDTGSGMSSEVRARIFEAFFTTKPEGQGTGLGLATVQRLVKSHGGFLRVDSELGHGSTFEVLLPRDSAASREPVQTGGALPGGQGQMILVIEDEDAIRELLGEALRANGYAVRIAPDGVQGLQLFRQHAAEVKLVITDSASPLLDGTRVVQEIRSVNATLPIVLVTAESNPGPQPNAVVAVTKPFALDALLSAVARLLAKSEKG